MNDVVPGALQRLSEADIVGLAGLASASLGREYCRCGYVLPTKRQDACLSGIVTLPEAEAGRADLEQPEQAASATISPASQRFDVEVEPLSRSFCRVVCSCEEQTALICAHAAALLYQWVNRPSTFASPIPLEEPTSTRHRHHEVAPARGTPEPSLAPIISATSIYAPLLPRQQSVSTIGETLAQLSLSELRSVAREYGINLAGLGKQQLTETLIETLSRPEAIRRVVGALEKAQRQLLAALALAGGLMSDEDLRGLFERFALGSSGTLQEMLLALQAKLLLVRTSFNHALQQRFTFSVSPLDLSWYIPQEVREALHVTLPVTPFSVDVPYGKEANASLPTLHLTQSSQLLADLLLSARALDGFQVEQAEKRQPRNNSMLTGGRLSADSSLALPPPDDQPAPVVIEALGSILSRSPAFLRFALHLLRLADILYKEGSWPTNLRVLSNAAQLLLGPTRNDLLHDLFTTWLTCSSYAELYELSEYGLRVRCRTTPLNLPDLRQGELEQENNDARQNVIALLAQVPVGEWISFSAFARFLYRLCPTFLQRRQRLFPTPHWWIEQEEGHPLHPTQLADWLRAEGRYLAHLIQEPLHWWGICDLAFSHSKQLLAFRLTPMADFFFRGLTPATPPGQSETPSPLPTLAVSAEGDLLIPCQPDNWPLIACIETFAESKGVQDEKLLYHLSARSLGNALSQGRDPHDLLALLRSSPVEDGDHHHALAQLLARMERRIANYGHVRLYTDVSLLQVADSSVMQQLSAITSLDQQVVRPLQPTLLLLNKQGADRVLEELKRRGQTPLLHEGEGERWN